MRRAEGVELSGHMAVFPDRLGQVDGADNGTDVRRSQVGRRPGRLGREALEGGRTSCEGGPGGGIDRGGIAEVALVQVEDVPSFIPPTSVH